MNSVIYDDMKFITSQYVDWNRFKDKTILITGASGMLASYMVYTLAYLNKTKSNFNSKLLLQVRDANKARKRFDTILDEPFIKIIQFDISEIFNIEEKVDFIVHAASLAKSDIYTKYPVQTLLPNVIGTWQLLEYARKNKVEGFLFFSSDTVYGKIIGENIITEQDLGLLDQSQVRSCYAESKRMGENMCVSYASEYGVPACAVRISHTYGPTMDLGNDSRVFAEFVSNIVNNENIVMKSDGLSKRAFCYLADATVAFFLVLLNGKPGEMYNMVNSDCFISIKYLAEMLVRIVPEKHLKIIHECRKGNDTYSENTNANFVANSNVKLKSLGWNPSISVLEGFTRTLRSYMLNDIK